MQRRTFCLLLCVFLVLLGAGLLLLGALGMSGAPEGDPARMLVMIAGGALGFCGVMSGAEAIDD